MSNEQVKGLTALARLAKSDPEVQEFLKHLCLHMLSYNPDFWQVATGENGPHHNRIVHCSGCDLSQFMPIQPDEPSPTHLSIIQHDPGCIGELLAIVAGYTNGSLSR